MFSEIFKNTPQLRFSTNCSPLGYTELVNILINKMKRCSQTKNFVLKPFTRKISPIRYIHMFSFEKKKCKAYATLRAVSLL